jgi:mannose-1-phosphate guanylyltransferase/phosphomannomutase
MPDAVRDYFGDGRQWDVTIRYSVEKDLLGTAGGLKKVESFFDGPFFVWYGDNLSNIDLHRFAGFHRQKGGEATVALFYREDPTASGIVGLDQDKRITRFLEKPTADQVFSNWVSAGIYLLETSIFDYIPAGTVSDFGHDVLPDMLADGVRLHGYEMAEDEQLFWIDTPSDLQRIQEHFLRRHHTT